jgi:hypothetical protein
LCHILSNLDSIQRARIIVNNQHIRLVQEIDKAHIVKRVEHVDCNALELRPSGKNGRKDFVVIDQDKSCDLVQVFFLASQFVFDGTCPSPDLGPIALR